MRSALAAATLAWFAAGVVFYAFVVQEHGLLDALLLLVSIVTTLGFGDPWVPTSTASKLGTAVLVVLASAFVATAVGVLASTLVHSLESTTSSMVASGLHLIFPRNVSMPGRARTTGQHLFAAALRSIAVACAIIAVGGVLFHAAEPETFGWADSFYFASTTASTVGFGDIVPKTTLGKLCVLAYILPCCYLFASRVSAAASLHAREEQRKLWWGRAQKLSLPALTSMDTNGDGYISEAEFELWALRAFATPETRADIARHFRELAPPGGARGAGVSIAHLHRMSDGAIELHALLA